MPPRTQVAATRRRRPQVLPLVIGLAPDHRLGNCLLCEPLFPPPLNKRQTVWTIAPQS